MEGRLMIMTECALWYWRHHHVTYDICESEIDAAEHAVYLNAYGEGMPTGVQFSDGRLLKLNDWPTYQKAYQAFRIREEAEEAERDAQPPLKVREILDPFDGKLVTVLADTPTWLGLQINKEHR
jgi:hypothetical protein